MSSFLPASSVSLSLDLRRSQIWLNVSSLGPCLSSLLMSTHESWMIWSLLRGCLHADHLEWRYPSVVWRHSLQEWSSAALGKDHLSKQFWCRSELPPQVYSMRVLWRGWTASISIDTVIAEEVRRLTQMTPPQSDKVSQSPCLYNFHQNLTPCPAGWFKVIPHSCNE